MARTRRVRATLLRVSATTIRSLGNEDIHAGIRFPSGIARWPGSNRHLPTYLRGVGPRSCQQSCKSIQTYSKLFPDTYTRTPSSCYNNSDRTTMELVVSRVSLKSSDDDEPENPRSRWNKVPADVEEDIAPRPDRALSLLSPLPCSYHRALLPSSLDRARKLDSGDANATRRPEKPRICGHYVRRARFNLRSN